MKLIEEYSIEIDNQKVSVKIFEHPIETRYYYYVVPPEFNLDREQMEILITVREILAKMRYLERAKDVSDAIVVGGWLSTYDAIMSAVRKSEAGATTELVLKTKFKSLSSAFGPKRKKSLR